jgi:hypothetical protein
MPQRRHTQGTARVRVFVVLSTSARRAGPPQRGHHGVARTGLLQALTCKPPPCGRRARTRYIKFTLVHIKSGVLRLPLRGAPLVLARARTVRNGINKNKH